MNKKKLILRTVITTCILFLLMLTSLQAEKILLNSQVLVDGNLLKVAPGALMVDAVNAFHFVYGYTELKYGFLAEGSDDYQTEFIQETLGQGITATLGLTTDNRPMIAWFDQGTAQMYLTEKVDDQWVQETIPTQDQWISGFDFAIDSQDQPCIVYTLEEPDQLVFTRRVGTQWNSVVIDDGATYTRVNIALALDSADLPHIAMTTWYDFFYVFPSGTAWEKEVVSTRYNIEGVDLILDATNHPHAVVKDRYDLMYWQKTVSGWVGTTIDTVPDYSWYNYMGHSHCSIAMTDEGEIRVAYPTHGSFLNSYYRIAAFDGISWSILTTLPVDCWKEFQSAFALQDGDPSLLYYENNTGMLKHYRYGNGSEETRLVENEVKPVTNHIFQTDSQDFGHVIWYSVMDNTIYYLRETLAGWIQDVVLTGAPLSPDVTLQLALTLDNQEKPVIACGIPDGDLLVLRYNETEWSGSIIIEGSFLAADLNIVVDVNSDIHLAWRTGYELFHAIEKSGAWTVSELITIEDTDDRLVSSVELSPGGDGSVYLAYTLGRRNMGSSYSMGMFTFCNVLKLHDDTNEEVFSQYGMAGDIRKLIDLNCDPYGDVLYTCCLENYAGCGTAAFTYFGKITGYPDTACFSYKGMTVGSLTTDIQGNPIVIDRLMGSIYKANVNDAAKYKPYNSTSWTDSAVISSFYGTVVDMKMADRNKVKICHFAMGDLVVSTQIPAPIDLQLRMPHNYFAPGDPCNLKLSILNDGSEKQGIPLWTILEFAGQYFYLPSWDSNTDYRRINIPKGETIIDLLPEFPWPDTGPDIIQGNYV
ncbi:hypothetical protein K8T06_09035, partial [bacterium]|nr:hypothetical protein [bacterium]